MSGDEEGQGPDLEQGVPADELAEGTPLVGHAGGEAVMLVRRGGEVLATGATCTHYGGPLGEGLIVGDTVRCPWHHARFSLRTGEAIGAPALKDIPCWTVRREGARVRVESRREVAPAPRPSAPAGEPVVIVGGGPAGAACAEML